MSNSGNPIMVVVLIAIVAIAIYAAYKKRKESKAANPFLSSRKDKDEVWKTIKQFLRDSGEKGKELSDSYVVKRNHVDMVDPNGNDLYKKNKNYELKIRKWQRDEINKSQPKGSKKVTAPKARDQFVVVFTTKDTKTGQTDAPRAFECEVINTKISKKQYDRKIVINKALDYDTEMEWIAPVRAAEAAKAAEVEKRVAKQKAAEAKKEKKRRERAEKKALRHANKKK